MATKLGYEATLAALDTYYQELGELNPTDSQSQSTHDELFPQVKQNLGIALELAQEAVSRQICWHALSEYRKTGFGDTDLRKDNDEERANRAAVLAGMTAATTSNERVNHARMISIFLSGIVGGKMLPDTVDNGALRVSHSIPQAEAVDPTRTLYAVFASRPAPNFELRLQYDSPSVHPDGTAPIGRPFLYVNLPQLFTTGRL